MKEGTYFKKGKDYVAVIKRVFTTSYKWLWLLEHTKIVDPTGAFPKLQFVDAENALEGYTEIDFETWRIKAEKVLVKGA